MDLTGILANKQWRKRGQWHHTVTSSEISEGEMGVWPEKLGFTLPASTIVWMSNGDWLDEQSVWDETKKYLVQNYEKDRSYFISFADLCESEGEKLIAFADDVQKREEREMRSLTNEEIGALFVDLIDRIKAFFPFMFTVHPIDEYLTERFDTLLNDFIKKENLSRSDFFEYQTALALPYKKIFVLEEKYALMQLAIEIASSGGDIINAKVQKQISAHQKKYGWINSHLLEHEPYTVAHYTERLKDMLATDIAAEYAQITVEENRLRELQTQYKEKVAPHKELSQIAALVQRFGFLRSFRVDVPYLAYGRCDNLIREIMRRTSSSWTDLTFLDSREIQKFLTDISKDSCRSLVAQRKRGFVSMITASSRTELIGDEMAEVEKLIVMPEHIITEEVKGQTAYPGKITGTCKVLHSLKDMEKVERGDILVISMTDPNYIPAMEKAAAFVTDQGGILCHAAIVSREMKKPCVIGTKVATKTFKDGDTLEVDADAGTVRKASV